MNILLKIVMIFVIFIIHIQNFAANSMICPILFSHKKEQPRSFLKRYINPADRLSDLNPKLKFLDVASVVWKILSIYPIDKHYFIGIGRSPFIFTDMIELISPGISSTVPISYHDYSRKTHFYKNKNWVIHELEPFLKSNNDLIKKNFYEHMKLFMPSQKQLGTRQIVLIDFVEYGASLAKFSADLSEFFKLEQRFLDKQKLIYISKAHEKDETWHLHMYLKNITDAFSDKTNKNLKHKDIAMDTSLSLLPEFIEITLSDDLSDLGMLLNSSALKAYAPYNHYVPIPTSKYYDTNLKPRAKHDLFVEVLSAQFHKFYQTNDHFKTMIDRLRINHSSSQ